MTKAQYPRVLRFDLSTVTRNIAGPSNPHARVSTADLKEKVLQVWMLKSTKRWFNA
jgi:aconitate hydratase